ncbi:bifunctional biotin--[acetyl-CoA-carboxylase] ligase/biotin operon repressor BirA [soil metagenome]
MNDPTHRDSVIRLLADGAFHSGEAVATRMGVSRSAVWKHVRALDALGLEAEAVRGKGYRLTAPIELLEASTILQSLPQGVAPFIERLEIFSSLSSTNSHLAGSEPPSTSRARVCLTEHQTAGRGRRGRPWHGVFGGGLCLSIAWHYGEQPAQLAALALALGVGAQRALAATGVPDVRLKWPNDLLWHGHKLGGILIELSAESGGPAHVIAGIGINLRLPAGLRRRIVRDGGRSAVDLGEICAAPYLTRNRLAGAVIGESITVLQEFAAAGAERWLQAWNALDACADREVTFDFGRQRLRGIARGVDSDGALKMEIGGRIRRFASGEISPRLT